MNRKFKSQKDVNSSPSLFTPPDVKPGGAGQSEKRARPARFFSRPLKRKGLLNLWRGIGQQINDNIPIARAKSTRLMRVAALTLMFGVLATMNSSAIITQAVLHTDDAVLAGAMDINPDALAFVLNQMDIGE